MFEKLKQALSRRQQREEADGTKAYETLISEAIGGKLDTSSAKAADRVAGILDRADSTFADLERDVAARQECAKLEALAGQEDALRAELKAECDRVSGMEEGWKAARDTYSEEHTVARRDEEAAIDRLRRATDARQALVRKYPTSPIAVRELIRTEVGEIGSRVDALQRKIARCEGTIAELEHSLKVEEDHYRKAPRGPYLPRLPKPENSGAAVALKTAGEELERLNADLAETVNRKAGRERELAATV